MLLDGVVEVEMFGKLDYWSIGLEQSINCYDEVDKGRKHRVAVWFLQIAGPLMLA
jgi:hypothetical protein